jgi:hypothetical protein
VWATIILYTEKFERCQHAIGWTQKTLGFQPITFKTPQILILPPSQNDCATTGVLYPKMFGGVIYVASVI